MLKMYYTKDISYGASKATYGLYTSADYNINKSESSVRYSTNYSKNTKAMCGKGCNPCIGCRSI